jgi:hypothetical protein
MDFFIREDHSNHDEGTKNDHLQSQQEFSVNVLPKSDKNSPITRHNDEISTSTVNANVASIESTMKGKQDQQDTSFVNVQIKASQGSNYQSAYLQTVHPGAMRRSADKTTPLTTNSDTRANFSSTIKMPQKNQDFSKPFHTNMPRQGNRMINQKQILNKGKSNCGKTQSVQKEMSVEKPSITKTRRNNHGNDSLNVREETAQIAKTPPPQMTNDVVFTATTQGNQYQTGDNVATTHEGSIGNGTSKNPTPVTRNTRIIEASKHNHKQSYVEYTAKLNKDQIIMSGKSSNKLCPNSTMEQSHTHHKFNSHKGFKMVLIGIKVSLVKRKTI